jgi:DNA repair protein RecO (recombination protein O)
MIERALGLVLRTRPLTETSLIVQWLTPAFGRLDTVAKGAQRPKSPFRGKLDLFYLADFTFRRSRTSTLHTLSEVSLQATHSELREDLARLRQASYCAALVEQATETDTPLPSIFALVRDLLAHVCRQPPAPQTVFAFELKLLHELGLSPDPEQSRLQTGTKQILKTLVELDWPLLTRLKLSPAQTLELSRFLQGFLVYHLDRIPRGRETAVHPDHLAVPGAAS